MYQLTITCEDKDELIVHAKASDYMCFIEDFKQRLRNYYKHGMPENILTRQDALILIRDEFNNMLDDYGIS